MDAWSTTGEWSWSDAADVDAPWCLPEAADRYLRGGTLHAGTMSEVQLAEDPLLRRSVVLKCAPGDPEGPVARRLLREARITAALRVPGVPPVLDAGVDGDGRPWFAMPVLTGRTLARAIEEDGPGPHHVPHILAAARVVARAHAVGIVHRDLKPEHILIDPEGQVWVLDWGIARPAAASSEWDAMLSLADQTGQGLVLGTPDYMSPEQVIGGAVDAPSDVWALGCCLVEALQGTPPFSADTSAETLRSVVHASVPRLLGATGTVVAACLSRDPAARPGDAGVLAEQLEAALAPVPPASGVTSAGPRPLLWGAAAVVAVGLGVVVGARVVPSVPSAPLVERPGLDDHVLAAHARTLAQSRRPDAAAMLAAHGLTQREDAYLRGILAAAYPEVSLVETAPFPHCDNGLVADDGRDILCRTASGLSLVDVATGTVRWQHPFQATAGCITPDQVIASPAGRGFPRVFDRATGVSDEERLVLPSGEGFTSSGVSGLCFVRGTVRTMLALQLDADPPQYRNLDTGLGTPLADGSDLLVYSDRYVQRVGETDVAQWPRMSQGNGDTAHFLRSAPGQLRLLEGSLDGFLRQLDLRSATVRRVSLPQGMVHDAALSPSATRVAAVDEQSGVWVWPWDHPSARRRLPTRGRDVAFQDDDTLVVLGDRRETWRLSPVAETGIVELSAGVSGLDLRGEYLAAALGDGTVVRRHRTTGVTDVARINASNVAKDVSLGPDGSAAAVTLTSGQMRGLRWLWSRDEPMDQVKSCRRVVFIGPEQVVCQTQVNPGPLVADRSGRTWPQVERAAGLFLDSEPWGDRRGAVMSDSNGGVWTVAGGAPPVLTSVLETGTAGAVAMHGPDQPFYIARAESVERHDPEDPDALLSLPVPSRPIDLALSPDGVWLAAGLMSGDVFVWRTADHAVAAVLVGHTERVSSLVFSDDSSLLATGSWDHTVRSWDLGRLTVVPAEVLRGLEERLGRSTDSVVSMR